MTGPIPDGIDPEEYERRRRRVLWKMPSGLYIIGSRAGDRRNGMTCSWVTQLSVAPKLVGIGVERQAVTHRLIHDGRLFSVCILDRGDRGLVRKFVKPAAVDPVARTMNGIPFHDAPSGAPVLDQALAWLDCALCQEVEVGDHTLFVGEVAACAFQGSEQRPVLRTEDTRMSYGG